MKNLLIIIFVMGYTCNTNAQRLKHKVSNNNNNTWKEIGEVKANYGGDHDAIFVQGPFDDFRKVKLKVSSADVNMQRMVITYDNGGKDEIPLKFVIREGETSRVIDLKGGKRSLRKIEFWFDTKGRFSGKARVTVFGRR